MTENLIEFLILILTLVGIFIAIFRLYTENIRLRNSIVALKNSTIALKKQNQKLQTNNEVLEQKSNEISKLKEIELNYNQLLGKSGKIEEELTQAKAQNALYNTKIQEFQSMQERTKGLQDALKEKEILINTLKEQMVNEFKNLSNELLEKKQESMQKSSKLQLEQILEPFDKELKEFKNTISKINIEQNGSISMLRGELTQLKELNNNLSKDAKELAVALKGDNKLQGNWGELVLDRALEASGLKRGVEYKREVELYDDSKKFRADVVIYLPEGKHLIIDSKVSLNSYIGATKASDEQTKRLSKTKLLLSIKRHIDTLAQKRYHMLDDILTPEFTLMFIPIEPAFAMALEQDNNLLEYALQRGVSIVTPTTLFATLKSIATIWRLSNHDKNMQNLAKEAGSLHYKFALFLEEFNKIQQRLNQAQSSWESAKVKLNSGQGSLYSKIQKVGELSGRAKKELPKLKESN
jgi:DNA recombination protein RmuC